VKLWTIDDITARCDEAEGDCWLWRLSLNKGVPQGRVNGKAGTNIRRYVFALANGKRALKRQRPVMPMCGHSRCLQPGHLEQLTHSEFNRHMYAMGYRSKAAEAANRINRLPGPAKLSPDHVRQIRAARAAGARTDDLAHAYGVNASTIRRIVKGVSWRIDLHTSAIGRMVSELRLAA
jgi:hypothetical protein